MKIRFLAEGWHVGFWPSKALKSWLGLGKSRKEGQEENHWMRFIDFKNRMSGGGGQAATLSH